MPSLNKQSELTNIGLLILRIGLGVMFILHGYPKMFGGPDTWVEVGSAMEFLGIHFAPMFFGFMAGVAEFFGGIFLLLGVFFTPTISLLLVVMIVATIKSVGAGEGFGNYSHSIELAIVFISLIFTGPGSYSLDQKLKKQKRRRY